MCEEKDKTNRQFCSTVTLTNDKLDNTTLEVWKKAIETQMHFNDLIIRNRTIAISFITAIFGVAAFSLKESDLLLLIHGKQVHVSALIILFEVCFLIAYAILDVFYYFPLLIGAVSFTTEMDKKFPEHLGLTEAINKKIVIGRSRAVLIIYYLFLLSGAFIVLYYLFFAN